MPISVEPLQDKDNLVWARCHLFAGTGKLRPFGQKNQLSSTISSTDSKNGSPPLFKVYRRLHQLFKLFFVSAICAIISVLDSCSLQYTLKRGEPFLLSVKEIVEEVDLFGQRDEVYQYLQTDDIWLKQDYLYHAKAQHNKDWQSPSHPLACPYYLGFHIN